MTDPKPAKRPATKAPAAKAPAPKAAPAKTSAAKASTAKAAATKAPPAKAPAVPPVVPAPVVATPVAATAAPGWYPVAGTTQQRWWDGTAWTQHVYDPATAQPVAASTSNHPKAPEGTNPTTVWFWITAVSPVIGIIGLIPTGIAFSQLINFSFDTEPAFNQFFASPAYLASWLLGLVELAAYILFPILDWRALEKRGVPKPFHWAWSLIAIAVSTPAVYVIGRAVVVKRRTGKGLAPLWVFTAVQIIAWIIGLIVAIAFLVSFFAAFANLLNDSNEVF